jgi:hypothetical protein
MPYAEAAIENKGPYRSLKDDGTAFICSIKPRRQPGFKTEKE